MSTTSMDSTPSLPRRILRSLRIELAPGVSFVNFTFYLVACLFTIAFFVFFNSTQTFVLSFILKEPADQLGRTNGSLVFYDQIVSLVLLGTWGALSDKIGRRSVYVIGFLFMALSMFTFPYAKNVYPQLLLLRFIFGMGASATSSMVTAVLADYVTEEGRGKVSGTVGLITGVGALLGAFVLLRLPTFVHSKVTSLEESLQFAYLICGSISVAVAIVLLFTLKAGENDALTVKFWRDLYHKYNGYEVQAVNEEEPTNSDLSPLVKSQEQFEEEPPKCPFNPSQGNPGEERMGCTMPGYFEVPEMTNKSFWALVAEGFRYAWKRPHIMLAYFGGFVARGDSIIVTLFLPTWINNYYEKNHLCQAHSVAGEPVFENPLKKCQEAFTMSSTYSGIAQTFALVAAPVFGYLCDRIGRTKAFILASIFAFAGYFPFLFIDSPVKNKALFGIMGLVGLGEIGLIVTSLSLATGGLPKSIRGSVAGCYSLFGGLGVMILTELGGILADVWLPTAPFVLVSFFCLVCLVGAFAALYWERRQR